MPIIVGDNSYISSAYLRNFDTAYEGAFSSTRIDECVSVAFDLVNEVVVSRNEIPVQRKANGDYDGHLKDWQALTALVRLYMGNAPDKSDAFEAKIRNDVRSGIEDRYTDGKWLLDIMISQAEIGIQRPQAAEGNSGSGKMYTNYKDRYYGNIRQTYTFEITGLGASGTALYKWKTSKTGTYTTGLTTSSDWIGVDSGLNVRFEGEDADSFLIGDIYTEACIPHNEADQGGPTSAGLLSTSA